MWRSDISHLLDRYSKTIPVKLSCIWHISCCFFFGRFFFIFPNEMSTSHGSNTFPYVPIVAGKIGKKFTWQKECVLVQGWGNTSKCSDYFARQRENIDVAFSVHSISFSRGTCQISIIHILCLSVHAGLDSWSLLLWARNLLFSVQYIAMSHFQLCLRFSNSALGNEMHPVLLWKHLNWYDKYFRCYKL